MSTPASELHVASFRSRYPSLHPVRWTHALALVVAAVVLSSLLLSDRSPAFGPDESTFVPITPCRLFDTRLGEANVGVRSGALPGGTEVTMPVTGVNGQCALPVGATAVSINLAGLGATSSTFVSIWPAGETNPGTAVLNLAAGEPPRPNKIDVKLSAGGAVTLYNAAGKVHLVGDVMGYYTDAGLTDLDGRVAALEDAAPTSSGVPQAILDRLDALDARVADLEAENATLEAELAAVESRVATIEENEVAVEASIAGLGGRVSDVEELTADMSIVTQDGARTVRFGGVNLQVVNGTGSTSGTPNGAGNLIVGYSAQRSGTPAERTGSHNLIVGDRHEYISYGGSVMGHENSIWGAYNSVVGGRNNVAGIAAYASVLGGSFNVASGGTSSVSGGYGGEAAGSYSSVSGGWSNTAQGSYASILGGRQIATVASQFINGGTTNVAISAVGGQSMTCGTSVSPSYDVCYDLNNWMAANQG